MNYSVNEMKLRKNEYESFSILLSAMTNYSYDDHKEDNLKLIDAYCEDMFSEIILPSGRVGSPLAVALETHNYTVSKYLIDNKERLRLDLNIVSVDRGSKETFSFKDELNFSLSYFDIQEERKKIEFLEKHFGSDAAAMHLKRLEEQIKASEDLKNMVNKKIY